MAATQDGSQLTGRAREQYVAGMFDRIAGRYDCMNRIISLGRDLAWRRQALDIAGVAEGMTAVDLGTGTGDFFLLLNQRVGERGKVIGIDIAANMLEAAKHKAAEIFPERQHDLRLGAADRTELPDASADVVTMGWVLRNVGDRASVYREVLRILKPGGKYICIDMSTPESWFLRTGSKVYLNWVMPAVVTVIGGDRTAYTYLANSTSRFPGRRALEDEWRTAGFATVESRAFMMGSIALHIGTKG